MITTAFIVEYNPFHNGHKLHLEKSKQITNATHCIGIMSGNFIQRGGPALFDKWHRAALAVKNGVDLVIELPVLFASQSSEIFAKGSISILNQLNMVDNLVFGSESNDVESLLMASELLANESELLSNSIKENLKLGIPYPKARENALKAISKVDLSTTSNDILGLEYTKQLILQKSSIKPHTIKRTGSTYNSLDLVGQICSATAIREQLKTTLDINLQNFVPLPTYAMLEELVKLDKIIHDESFFECIRYNIICNLDRLSDIFDVNEGLHNKIYKAALTSSTLDELASSIKSKRFTYTRINRILFNILLEITKSDMDIIINTTSPAPYVRVLAFNQKGTELLNLIKKTSSIPIINKVSAFTPETELQRISFNYDTKATRIYNLINRTSKKAFDLGSNLDQDYYKSPVFIK